MTTYAYVNEEIHLASEATVSILDRGYLLGDGVFETLRTTARQPWDIEAHERRLLDGLEALGVASTPVVAQAFREAVESLANAGDHEGDRYIRVNATTGTQAGLLDDGEIRFTGLCRPLATRPATVYEHGLKVVTTRNRKHSADPLASVKTLSFATYVTAKRFAAAQGADDGLILNEHGHLVEATAANVYAYVEGSVHAPGPKSGAIPGTTRATLLAILADEGIPVEEALTPAQLTNADEAWLSNTTGGVMPVTKFDGNPVGDGRVGPLARRLHRRQEAVRRAH